MGALDNLIKLTTPSLDALAAPSRKTVNPVDFRKIEDSGGAYNADPIITDRYTGPSPILRKAQGALDVVNRLGQKTSDTLLLTDRTQYGGSYTPVATRGQEKFTDIGGAIIGSVAPYGGIYKALDRLAGIVPATQKLRPLTQAGVKGGIAGGTYETAVGVGHGEAPADIAKRAAIGTAAGALGDVALSKVPGIIGAMREANQLNKVNRLDLTRPYAQLPPGSTGQIPEFASDPAGIVRAKGMPEQKLLTGSKPKPIEERTFEEAGSRSVKAYQYEHPELKPFIQTEANRLLGELRDTIKGQRTYTQGDDGTSIFGGNKRLTGESIARIKDQLDVSYMEIGNALARLVEDKGLENNALSKRIELIIDDNLTSGVKDITGMELPPIQEYINLKHRMDWGQEKQLASNIKPLKVYRGYASGQTAKEANLTRVQNIFDVIGKENKKYEPVDVEYYTESSDVAKQYANQDMAIMEGLIKSHGELKAKEIFTTLVGRSPMKEGVVKEHQITPSSVLDLSDLGESPRWSDVINKLLEAEGSPVPKWVKGDNINSPKWKRFNEIEEQFTASKPGGDGEILPVWMLLRNYAADDTSAHKFVEWLKNNKYDAIRYAENGTRHYAVLPGARKPVAQLTLQNPKIPIQPTQELTAARNILRNNKLDINRAAKILETYPQLQPEFKGWVGRINRMQNQPAAARAPMGQGPTVAQGAPMPQNRPMPDTRRSIVTKTKKQPFNLLQSINKGYTKTVDNLYRINNLDNYVEKRTGQKLKPQDRAYLLALNSRGADMISSHILEERLVNAKGEVIGNALSSITKQIPKNKLVDFEDYLVHRHAPSWMNQGRKVFRDELGVTPEVSAAKVAQYEQTNPEFKALAENWDQWYKDFGKAWLVDTGLMSEKLWNQLRAMYPHYVKLQREMAPVEKSQWSLMKRATGSERPIVSPLESIIEDIDHVVKLAKRNEAMQALYRQIEKNPEDMKVWGEIEKVETPKTEPPKQSVIDEPQDEIEQMLTEIDSSFEQAKIDPKHGNGLIVKVDGKPVRIKVFDPMLLEAMSNFSVRGQGQLIEASRQITRQIKNLTTGINPVFSLARNIFRDIPMAYVSSKSTNNPFTFAKDLVGSFVSVIRNDELYKSFKAVGGGHASSVSADRNLLAESKSRILPGYINPKKPLQAANRLAGKGISYLERLNNTIEAAPRLGEFKRFSKEGSYDSRLRGLYEANDVTVNFKRHSNLSHEADAIFMYFNAAVQGIDKSIRIYKDNPVQAGLKSFLAVTVPTVALYAINHTDPNYQKLSSHLKDNNFLFPKGDGTFVKIPKPREVGTAFGSGVERVLRRWNEQDPEAFDKFSETIKLNFLPPTRTTFHPIVRDIPANKDFINRPIVPGYMQDMSPRLQYDEKTSAPAKAIGNAANFSPKNIDYILKSYTGVVGQLGIPATAPGSTVGKTLKSQVTSDPLYSNDTINDFYEVLNRLNTANADYKQTKVKNEDLDEPMRKAFNRAAGRISNIRKEIRKVQANKLIGEKQKEERLRRMQQNILDISNSTLQRYGKRVN